MRRTRGLIAAAAIAMLGMAVPFAAPDPASAATQVPTVVNPRPSIDPASRASVWSAYQSSLVEARAVPVGWTGDAASCSVGTESPASIEATLAAVNFYRGLNRLPPVTFSADLNARSLQGALLMHANNAIEHYPPSTWRCWTQTGADAAGSSNLSNGAAGARAIDLYMADPGSGNEVAGHRRWLLNPRASEFGTGSTNRFNVLGVFGADAPRPADVSWVSWPNAGFVPKDALRSWQFPSSILMSLSSSTMPGAEYDDASVSVRVGGAVVPATVHPERDGFGDDTLTFDVPVPAGWDRTSTEFTFEITVSGITNAGQPVAPYTWTSTAITSGSGPAATAPAAPAVPAATAGDGQAVVSWTAPADGGSAITGYRVTPYIGTTAQPVRTFDATATSRAITGLANGTAYSFEVQAVNAAGTGPASARSAAVTPVAPAPIATTPDAPTDPQVFLGRTQLVVAWQAPASDGGSAITGYLVTPYVDGVAQPVLAFDASQRYRYVTDLRSGATYEFTVQAVNAAGAGATSERTSPVTAR